MKPILGISIEMIPQGYSFYDQLQRKNPHNL